jgi:LuxR family maltose regulon positive regulatory protein
MLTSLIATKYCSPPLRLDCIPRPWLLNRLEEIVRARQRLLLLSAPAGYGKTTLLLQWATRQHAHSGWDPADATHAGEAPLSRTTAYAWLTLDSTDTDPLRFIAYLLAAIQKVLPQSCATTAALLQDADPALLPMLLPTLTNDIAAAPGFIILILDDYHVVSAQAVHDVVAFLIKYAPGNLQIVISTRADPPLPLAHLRGRNQMDELRQQELRFTRTEATQLLATALPLPEHAPLIDLLCDRAEGWPAGLQMAALSLQRHDNPAAFVQSFSGSHRHIIDYLSEEVFNCQTPEVQRFLLRTSLLERLCAPLCQTLVADCLDGSDASAILARLEQDNLFVLALDDQRRWYRYHHLFSDLLRQRLQAEMPALVPELHRRAAQWCADAGLMHEAIEHSLQSDDHERSADLITYMAESVMKSSEVATLRRWIETLPAATLRARPLLNVYYSGAILLLGESTNAAEEQLRAVFSIDAGDAALGAAAAFQALAATLHGQNQTSNHLLQRALTLLPEHSPFFRSCVSLVAGMNHLFAGNDGAAVDALQQTIQLADAAGDQMNAVLARCYLAQLWILRGQMIAAAALYEGAVRNKEEPVNGLALLGLGLVYYDWNDLTHAERLLTAGLDQVAAWSEIPLAQGALQLARIKVLTGDGAAAQALVQRAEALTARCIDMLPVYRALELYLMRHALWCGDLDAAEYHAASAGLEHTDAHGGVHGNAGGAALASMEMSFVTLARTRLWLARRQYAAAAPLAEQLAEQSRLAGRMRLVAKAQILLALAAFGLGDASRATQMLGRAIALAAPEHSIRLFLDEGAVMAELLTLCRKRDIFPAYAALLLAAFAPGLHAAPAWPEHADHNPEAGALIEMLSQREMQVLRLMADGLSNHEIAQQLGIAGSTVKTHIHTIFDKLQATRRTQAIASARVHGLL